jgi:hypothetical protein
LQNIYIYIYIYICHIGAQKEKKGQEKRFISVVDRVVGTKFFLDLILWANNICYSTSSFYLCSLRIELIPEGTEVCVPFSSFTANGEKTKAGFPVQGAVEITTNLCLSAAFVGSNPLSSPASLCSLYIIMIGGAWARHRYSSDVTTRVCSLSVVGLIHENC